MAVKKRHIIAPGGGLAGSTKLIPTPERMYELWQDYVKWCAETPFIKNDFRGSEAKEVELRTERPPIIEGFAAYLSERNIINGLQNFFANTNNAYADFVEVMAKIRAESKGILLAGALANTWNANLAGRYLGIATVTETKVTHELEIGNIKKKLSQKDIKALTDISNKMNNNGERVIDRRKANK